ncbi:MAG: hypothetical protein IKO19_10240 [Candidatus Riflebacteria bacterium]|nr:hypothetical protein [Candidatus Riflebacteria bacterium]
MKNTSFKYIFSLMLASILFMVGCGSSNNPVSQGYIDSGIVNVSGNVRNLTGNGSVSFYTPTAARSSLNVTTSFRSSVANDGVYTFNTDENGNYSGQIPVGEYYVIAQNSDGTMKSVSAKQTFSSARAAVTQDIELTKTINISGTIIAETDEGKNDEGVVDATFGVIVYIEGLPFISVTDSTCSFKFNSVPCIESSENNEKYTITSTITYKDTVLTASKELTASDFKSGSDITNLQLSFVLDDNSFNIIKGYVYDTDGKPIDNHLVAAMVSSGQMSSAVTDSKGMFTILVSKKESAAQISADLINYTSVSDFTKSYTLTYNTNGIETNTPQSILLTEDLGEGFASNGSETLFIYKNNNNNYELYRTEKVYLPLNKYIVSDLDDGNYSYIIVSHDYDLSYNGYSMGTFEVKQGEDPQEISFTKRISINMPVIRISSEGVYSSYICLTTIENKEGAQPSYEPPEEVTVFSIIEDEYGDQKYTKLNAELDYQDATVATITFDAHMSQGIYKVYTGCSVSYNGMVATITSDPYTYVKPCGFE